jgi:hypothetical protein
VPDTQTGIHEPPDLAGLALGALDPEEGAQARMHVAGCGACQDALTDYERLVVRLRDVPDLQPHPQLWDAIATEVARAPRERAASHPLRRFARPPVLAWAAAIAVIAGLLAWNLALQLGGDGDERGALDGLRDSNNFVYGLVASMETPGATGRVFMSPDMTRGALTVGGLPADAGGRQYALWFVRDDQTRWQSATFSTDARGSAVVRLATPEHLYGFSGLAVSEVRDGKAAGPDLLTGPLY